VEASQEITGQSQTANQYNQMMLDTDMNTSVNGGNANSTQPSRSPVEPKRAIVPNSNKINILTSESQPNEDTFQGKTRENAGRDQLYHKVFLSKPYKFNKSNEEAKEPGEILIELFKSSTSPTNPTSPSLLKSISMTPNGNSFFSIATSYDPI
jgi:hypothetical protein